MTTPKIADRKRNTAELNFCNITMVIPFLLESFT